MTLSTFIRIVLWMLLRLFLALFREPQKFLRLVLERWKAILAFKRRRGKQLPCLPLSREILRKPDPLIYSQEYLMALGMAVTWDNPDIVLSRGGMPADSHNLKPDTEYTMAITVHNGSNEAPAIGLKVRARFRDWGTGGSWILIGESTIDLPVRGAPGEPATVNMTWRTPAAPGHYCVLVELQHVDDLNPANNRGQENTNVQAAASNPGEEVRMDVPIRHRLPGRRTLHLALTGYSLPEKPSYPPLPEGVVEGFQSSASLVRDKPPLLFAMAMGRTLTEIPVQNWTAYRIVQPSRPGRPTGLRQFGEDWLPHIVTANSPQAHPAPATWQPRLSQKEVTLDPDEETKVELQVVVPRGTPRGTRQRFQVNALDALTGLVGGVELIVDVR